MAGYIVTPGWVSRVPILCKFRPPRSKISPAFLPPIFHHSLFRLLLRPIRILVTYLFAVIHDTVRPRYSACGKGRPEGDLLVLTAWIDSGASDGPLPIPMLRHPRGTDNPRPPPSPGTGLPRQDLPSHCRVLATADRGRQQEMSIAAFQMSSLLGTSYPAPSMSSAPTPQPASRVSQRTANGQRDGTQATRFPISPLPTFDCK